MSDSIFYSVLANEFRVLQPALKQKVNWRFTYCKKILKANGWGKWGGKLTCCLCIKIVLPPTQCASFNYRQDHKIRSILFSKWQIKKRDANPFGRSQSLKSLEGSNDIFSQSPHLINHNCFKCLAHDQTNSCIKEKTKCITPTICDHPRDNKHFQLCSLCLRK